MSDNVPQFGIAEYPSAPGTDTCMSCRQPAVGSYYRVNGALACARCKEQLEAQLPKDSHAAFVRGLMFGVGGAILGLILYSVFGIVTGIEIGYISLAVGYIVGKAMRMGSRGNGGRRYQLAAVILTYAAVSMSAIPIAISQYANGKMAPPQALQSTFLDLLSRRILRRPPPLPDVYFRTDRAQRFPRTHSQLPQLRRQLASRCSGLRAVPFSSS